MQDKIYILIAAGTIMFAVIGVLSLLAHYYTLNGIKSRTVGDGQHGTARFATKKEIERTYKRIPFRPKVWRKGQEQPKEQGIILGSLSKKNEVTALVDTDDVHTLMIGIRSWQDGVLPLSQFGIRLRHGHELSLHRYQGRPVPKLRSRGPRLLRL